jgi:uncharacterized membrane protein YkvA (DUF1232 family)
MSRVWAIVLSVALGLLLIWLVLAVILLIVGRRYGTPSLREILRLLPDVLRLIKRLAGDKNLPRGVRVRLWLLLAYLAIPIDLIPDFVPLIGYADDAIVVALALRSVARHAGTEAIATHWPGTDIGLRTVTHAVGLAPRT